MDVPPCKLWTTLSPNLTQIPQLGSRWEKPLEFYKKSKFGGQFRGALE